MGGRHADRLWLIAGAVVIIALVLVGWFFVISPKYAEADEVQEQTASTESQIIVLRKRINELEKQKSKLPQYQAALKASQNALPSDSGLPDFLRQLETSGDDVNVTVGGVNVGGPALAAGFTSVYQLPITLTLEGSADNLNTFLTQLQRTQPRAVLINSVTVTSQVESGSADAGSEVTISLTLNAFVAVPAGQGAPTISTTPAK